jgi:predicted DNA-binding protein (UPF0251 family)
MLTPDELEVLRKWDNEAADYAQNVAHLRRKPEVKLASTQQTFDPVRTSHPEVLTPEEIEALQQTDNETDA